MQDAARRTPIRQGCFGVGRECRFPSGKYDSDVVPPCLELARSDEGVAAVVTRTRKQKDAFAALPEQLARDLGNGSSCERHQGRRRRLRQYRLFDLPDLFGEKNRGKCFRHKGSVNQTQPWAGGIVRRENSGLFSSTIH